MSLSLGLLSWVSMTTTIKQTVCIHLHLQGVAKFNNTLRHRAVFLKRALKVDQTLPFLTQWYAVCLSDVGEYEGVKVKIGNSYIIREHLEVRGHLGQCHIIIVSHFNCILNWNMSLFLQRAVELNPKDATSLHILGYWWVCFFTVANKRCEMFFFNTAASGASESSVHLKIKHGYKPVWLDWNSVCMSLKDANLYRVFFQRGNHIFAVLEQKLHLSMVLHFHLFTTRA